MGKTMDTELAGKTPGEQADGFMVSIRDSIARPSPQGLIFLLGLVIFGGSLAAGAAYYLQAADDLPRIVYDHLAAGDRLLESGRYEAAYEEYAAAVQINPAAQGFIQLGNAAYKAGRKDAAREALQAAIDLDPRNGEAHYRLGVIEWEDEQVDRAIERFESAIAARPGDAQAHLALGVAHFKAGDLESAAAEFETAVRIDPRLEAARRNLDAVRGMLSTRQRAQ